MMEQMRILHVLGSKGLGGAERWVYRFVLGLQEMGQDVSLILRKGSDPERVFSQNLQAYVLPFASVWDPLTKWGLKKLIKKHAPQIVQTYLGRATRLTSVPAASQAVHVARLGGYYKLQPFLRAQAWIGNTKGVCDYLLANGFPKNRVFQIYNFVELPREPSRKDILQLRKNLGLQEGDFVLLCPGRFVPVKGQADLLWALDRLRKLVGQGQGYRLILLGTGPLEPRLISLIQELSLTERVILPGWQDDPGPYYQLADLVVFPSLFEETLGNVILEAWSHKRPVVCTAFRGALEITRHGEDVFQVPCQDPDSLARAICQLMQDENLANTLAGNGFLRFKKDFGKEKILNEYLEVYHHLLR